MTLTTEQKSKVDEFLKDFLASPAVKLPDRQRVVALQYAIEILWKELKKSEQSAEEKFESTLDKPKTLDKAKTAMKGERARLQESLLKDYKKKKRR